MTETLKYELEQLVDKYGLRMVAENLVEVCHDKVEHLHTYWQDPVTAKVWRRIAIGLGNRVHFTNLEWPS